MVSGDQVETQTGFWSWDGGLVLDEPERWGYGREPPFDDVRAIVSDVGVKGFTITLYAWTVKISGEQHMGSFLLAEYMTEWVVDFIQVFSKISWWLEGWAND